MGICKKCNKGYDQPSTNGLCYECLDKQYSNAIYILNQVHMAFNESDNVNCFVGTKTNKKIPISFMHKIFLPEYIHNDVKEFIK